MKKVAMFYGKQFNSQHTLSVNFLGGGKTLLWYKVMYFLFFHDTCFNKINNFNLTITQKLKFKKVKKFIAHKGHS